MMSTIFPDFPHSLDDEPNENWTVEELLQWTLLKSHQATDQKHQEIVDALQKQFEQGKAELLELHAKLPIRDDFICPTKDENGHGTTTVGDKSLLAVSDGTSNNPDPSSTPYSTIQVTITTGPHVGKVFSLAPKVKAPCMIGRSAGKKFRDKGISLSKDSEVSTTHGKLERFAGDGQFYYTDVGSTNGTLYQGLLLHSNEPLRLEQGMELVLGVTTFQIKLLS